MATKIHMLTFITVMTLIGLIAIAVVTILLNSSIQILQKEIEKLQKDQGTTHQSENGHYPGGISVRW